PAAGFPAGCCPAVEDSCWPSPAEIRAEVDGVCGAWLSVGSAVVHEERSMQAIAIAAKARLLEVCLRIRLPCRGPSNPCLLNSDVHSHERRTPIRARRSPGTSVSRY